MARTFDDDTQPERSMIARLYSIDGAEISQDAISRARRVAPARNEKQCLDKVVQAMADSVRPALEERVFDVLSPLFARLASLEQQRGNRVLPVSTPWPPARKTTGVISDGAPVVINPNKEPVGCR